MLVLVTGPMEASDPDTLKESIKTLRARGVDVVAIGVGDVDANVLNEVSKARDDSSGDDRVWLSKYFSGALQYVQDVADFACGEGW